MVLQCWMRYCVITNSNEFSDMSEQPENLYIQTVAASLRPGESPALDLTAQKKGINWRAWSSASLFYNVCLLFRFPVNVGGWYTSPLCCCVTFYRLLPHSSNLGPPYWSNSDKTSGSVASHRCNVRQRPKKNETCHICKWLAWIFTGSSGEGNINIKFLGFPCFTFGNHQIPASKAFLFFFLNDSRKRATNWLHISCNYHFYVWLYNRLEGIT